MKEKRKKALELEQKKIAEELKKQKEAKSQGLSRVEIKAIEFDWLFDEDQGKRFLVSLATTDNMEVFSIDVIQNVILYMWKHYRKAIVKFMFIPFLIYFVLFILYATWINEEKFDEGDKDDNYRNANIAVIAFILLFIIFHTYLEIRQIMYYKTIYFQNFWNIIDLISLVINTFTVIADLAGLKERYLITFLAISVLLMWMKLAYFGRMFMSTAWLVRMFISITFDIRYFIIVFSLMVIAFANCFYIGSRVDHSNFIGRNGFWGAITYSYRTGLADFNTEEFPKNGFDTLIFIIWILSTFLILIVLLNMLIAIISDIFDKVYENMQNHLLKELVVLMVESEVFISRLKLFKNQRYIIMINKVTGNQSYVDAESKLQVIKISMDKTVDEQN